jgi:hypothetical protein
MPYDFDHLRFFRLSDVYALSGLASHQSSNWTENTEPDPPRRSHRHRRTGKGWSGSRALWIRDAAGRSRRHMSGADRGCAASVLDAPRAQRLREGQTRTPIDCAATIELIYAVGVLSRRPATARASLAGSIGLVRYVWKPASSAAPGHVRSRVPGAPLQGQQSRASFGPSG